MNLLGEIHVHLHFIFHDKISIKKLYLYWYILTT